MEIKAKNVELIENLYCGRRWNSCIVIILGLNFEISFNSSIWLKTPLQFQCIRKYIILNLITFWIRLEVTGTSFLFFSRLCFLIQFIYEFCESDFDVSILYEFVVLFVGIYSMYITAGILSMNCLMVDSGSSINSPCPALVFLNETEYLSLIVWKFSFLGFNSSLIDNSTSCSWVFR